MYCSVIPAVKANGVLLVWLKLNGPVLLDLFSEKAIFYCFGMETQT